MSLVDLHIYTTHIFKYKNLYAPAQFMLSAYKYFLALENPARLRAIPVPNWASPRAPHLPSKLAPLAMAMTCEDDLYLSSPLPSNTLFLPPLYMKSLTPYPPAKGADRTLWEDLEELGALGRVMASSQSGRCDQSWAWRQLREAGRTAIMPEPPHETGHWSKCPPR